MTDGIILIDKPPHMTSFGVVARVRRRLSAQAGHKIKVGHTGTLDPFATGLMILVAGKECRNASQYSKLDKVYEAIIRLGFESTTGDPEGELTPVGDIIPEMEQVRTALDRFVGAIQQTPPVFSAIKIGGHRAYKLARSGEMPEMPTRTVTVYEIELLQYRYPDIIVRAHVSSGTYIRSLAVDIGRVLGTGAYVTSLRRIAIAGYRVDDAAGLDDDGRLREPPVGTLETG